MALGLDKLASNLCGTSAIQCDKCKGNMELINIFGDYIASLGFERCNLKKTKGLDERLLEKNLNHTSRFWGSDENFRLKYMDGCEKFEETRLPPKNAFYGRLNMKDISDQGYEQAQQVWNTMEKKTLGCYHDTYLKTNVLLLVDAFEAFRNTCIEHYKLDPAHFETAPGLAWQPY